MEQPTLEERVAALEKTVARLIAQSNSPGIKEDWRSTVGMFDDDPVMKEIDNEGRKIREEDRRQAKQ
jgi:uncharacterized small protein (DUF1192 family)